MRDTPQSRYDAAHTRSVTFKFNFDYDADILSRLDSQPKETGGKQGYVKRLIREDIEKDEKRMRMNTTFPLVADFHDSKET